MLDWFKSLFGRTEEAKQRSAQRRRSRARSKSVLARERELRRQNQRQELKGGKQRTPFFWGSPGTSIPHHRESHFRDYFQR
jgi:hypothetical protein